MTPPAIRTACPCLASIRRAALPAAWALLLLLGSAACLGSPHRARHVVELGPAVPIPIQLYRERYVFCHGRVNGREVDMLLDSGAGVTVLSEALAAELALDGRRDSRVQGVGGRQAARWSDGVRLELGNLTLSELRVAVLDLSEIASALGRELPVILGREVFTSCVVDVDPARQTLSLRDPRSFEYEGPGATLPLIAVNGGWITLVRGNGGEPFQVDVDTGSGGNLTVFQNYAREAGLLALDLPPPTAFTLGVGGRNPVRGAVLDCLELGGYELKDVPIQIQAGDEGAFATSSADGNLGAGVLHRFRTIFDARRQRLHLEPGPQLAAPFGRNRAGLSVYLREGALEIVRVAPGSPAERDGWRVGERIVAIDGVAVDAAGGQTLFGWVNQPAGTPVTLTDGQGDRRVLVLEEPVPELRWRSVPPAGRERGQ